MNAHDVMRTALDSADYILNAYLGDFSDEDLLVRPTELANHTAWQLGHLIVSTDVTLKFFDAAVPLPDGFVSRYTKETARLNDAKDFDSKAVYFEIFAQQKAAVLKVLAGKSESDFDLPGEEKMRAYAPTIGTMLLIESTHMLMHLGQFAVARRKLGKPYIM